MKFLKGIMIGGLVATGMFMIYSENENKAKKKMIKKGRQFIKKMGII